MKVPVVLQSEAAECGLACLAMVAGHHGFRTDLSTLRRRWSVSMKGVNLAQLMAMAQALKMAPRALRLELDDLPRLKRPAILHWDMDHFVVLERVARRHVHIVDPARGRRTIPLEEVSRRFTGVALELTPTEAFERRQELAPLPLSAFFRRARGLARALATILLLSIALQAFLLVAPFFSQLVIDEIVVSGDRDLLAVLGIAFLLVAGIQVCIEGIRGWLVIALGAGLQFGWCARLMHHLIRLPLAWFEKRHIGDIVSRFGSIRAVEGLVARTAVEAIVDGLMAVTTLAVMVVYSRELTAIVLLAVFLYSLVRFTLVRALRLASQEALVLGARENSLFMESLRAVLPLKSFGREALREATWQNAKSDAVDADVRVARLELVQRLANTIIFAVENIAVLWLGALIILDGGLSLGMLVAFMAYKLQFGTRAAALVDKAIEFKLVRLHLDRIADIALADRDAGAEAAGDAPRRVAGGLTVRGLGFRYADTEPCVIDGLDLEVRAGQCIAIRAPSGFGKTTLIKLMMGLLAPTAGEVLVDGDRPLGAHRKQMAAVMQDDVLLSGSLADNIAFFDPQPDLRRIESCAKLAAVHDAIAAMPMGYSTLVGDMGSTLSGGQRQRVLLARALYARPRILFLDEATSHLDPATEARIHDALKRMRITRVMVAHRRETLEIADRVIDLSAAIAAGGPLPRC